MKRRQQVAERSLYRHNNFRAAVDRHRGVPAELHHVPEVELGMDKQRPSRQAGPAEKWFLAKRSRLRRIKTAEAPFVLLEPLRIATQQQQAECATEMGFCEVGAQYDGAVEACDGLLDTAKLVQ